LRNAPHSLVYLLPFIYVPVTIRDVAHATPRCVCGCVDRFARSRRAHADERAHLSFSAVTRAIFWLPLHPHRAIRIAVRTPCLVFPGCRMPCSTRFAGYGSGFTTRAVLLLPALPITTPYTHAHCYITVTGYLFLPHCLALPYVPAFIWLLPHRGYLICLPIAVYLPSMPYTTALLRRICCTVRVKHTHLVLLLPLPCAGSDTVRLCHYHAVHTLYATLCAYIAHWFTCCTPHTHCHACLAVGQHVPPHPYLVLVLTVLVPLPVRGYPVPCVHLVVPFGLLLCPLHCYSCAAFLVMPHLPLGSLYYSALQVTRLPLVLDCCLDTCYTHLCLCHTHTHIGWVGLHAFGWTFPITWVMPSWLPLPLVVPLVGYVPHTLHSLPFTHTAHTHTHTHLLYLTCTCLGLLYTYLWVI